MKRLDRYIASTVMITILIAALGLVGVLSIFTLLDQVENIQNNYRVANALLFVLLSMPRMFYEVIPFSVLIGCLAGLGILANNSELIVMRAAGISTLSLSWSAIKPALLLAVIGLYVGEYILPDVERTARINREKALSENNTISSTFGFWYREGKVYMHFNEVGQGGVLTGVSHYSFDDHHKLTRSLYAERAVFHDVRKDEQYWLLENVTTTEIKANRTETAKLTSLRWDTDLNPDLLGTEILVQPDKMSIGELSAKIEYMEAQGLDSTKFELGYWSKILQPLATIALVFVAISFIFGPLRESTMGMRLVTGLVIGIMFKFIQDLLAPASMVFGFEPVIAILLPILACFLVSYWLFRRAS